MLDAPCGFGRHSIPLARAGYRVTGADRSQALLGDARRRSEGERWPKRVHADYRDLPMADASFDLVVNLFASLGYLGDDEDTRALAEFRACCGPGPAGDQIMHRDLLLRVFAEQDWRLLGEGRLLLEQRTFDPAAGVVQITLTVIPTDGTRESRTMSLRVYTATELTAMLDGRASPRALLRGLRRYAVRHGAPRDRRAPLAAVAQRRGELLVGLPATRWPRITSRCWTSIRQASTFESSATRAISSSACGSSSVSVSR